MVDFLRVVEFQQRLVDLGLFCDFYLVEGANRVYPNSVFGIFADGKLLVELFLVKDLRGWGWGEAEEGECVILGDTFTGLDKDCMVL